MSAVSVSGSPRGRARSVAAACALLTAALVLACLLSASSARAAAIGSPPIWQLTSEANTNAAPGGEIQYAITVANVGDTPALSSVEPFKLTVRLPADGSLKALSAKDGGFSGWECNNVEVGAATMTCTNESREYFPLTDNQGFGGASNAAVSVVFAVSVDPSASGVKSASFEITGGGAPAPGGTVDPTTIASTLPKFGLDAFDGQVVDAHGAPFTQAGGHPYSVSTEIDFNRLTNPNPLLSQLWPVEPAKNVIVDLPAGFVGNPSAKGMEECTAPELANGVSLSDKPLCPIGSQVGIATVVANGGGSGENAAYDHTFGPAAIYNMVPPPDAPARFGFNVGGTVVTLDAIVRTDGDYSLSVTSKDIPEGLATDTTRLTFWGVPADPSHDLERNCPGRFEAWNFGPHCEAHNRPFAFLRNPTSCTPPGQGLVWKIHTDSWPNPGRQNADGTPDLSDPAWQSSSFTTHAPPNYPAGPSEQGAPLANSGCAAVPFKPTVKVHPTSHVASTPSGLEFTVSLPQEGLNAPGAVSESDLRNAVVTLPEGVTINAAAADGLAACSQAQIALHSTTPPECPDASKIGTVVIDTPLLAKALTGSVYLATQNDNPFNSLLAMYIVAQGSGVTLKVAGHIEADPVTGRLTTVVTDSPQQPFSTLTLTLDTGSHAPLSTPSSCGQSASNVQLTGWNGTSVALSDPYEVTCAPGQGSFAPGFTAGTLNPQAGAFSPFVLSLTRNDNEQGLSDLQQTLPEGLSAILAGVPECSETDANAGTCPASSRIGSVNVGAGVGPSPIFIPGSIYLTGPYRGGAFGEVVVVRAVAGPFDLGTVVVRGSIRIDRHTAQATVVSDPFPQLLQGIPTAVRRVDVLLDRPGFTFNPTGCDPLAVTGNVTSSQGAVAAVSTHFQAVNCANLPFAPKFTASTGASYSKQNGVGLNTKLTFAAPGQSNAHIVKVTVPKQLPARNTTLNKACLQAVFDANPAACPEGSLVGIAKAATPILPVPLTGPAYLVSHGGAKFPDLVVVLQGDGVRFDLIGNTNIKNGVTTSTFQAAPDSPITSFELRLPPGPHSIFTAFLPAKAGHSLCGQKLVLPTTMTAYNGKQFTQNTKVTPVGCPLAKKSRATKRHARRAARARHTRKHG
jgi:hypothetical protein